MPFEAAVREAGTWAMMTAYNRVHGTYCSEHADLIALLRDEWDFDGVVMSDWYGTHSTVPRRRTPASTSRCPARRSGSARTSPTRCARATSTRSALDDKVRRVLGLLERTGRLDDTAPHAEECVDDPRDRAVARRAARESFVLLQNDGAALPLAGREDARGDRPERRRAA